MGDICSLKFLQESLKELVLGYRENCEFSLKGVTPAAWRTLRFIVATSKALLEDKIISFVKNELKKIQTDLSPEDLQCFKSQCEDEDVLQSVDEEQSKRSREAFAMITVDFLKRIKQNEFAEHLLTRTCRRTFQWHHHQFKSTLKNKFQCVFEGIAKAGSPTLLNQIYTELYITEGGTAEVNDEHEVRQIETAFRNSDSLEAIIRQEHIFKASPGRDEPIRTVLTKGVAGIGKTVLTQKYTLDWAEDKANQDIQFIFPFTFRELNVLKEEKFSLVGLVHHFFTETKEAGICSFEDFQVVFILDGLDECRPPLDFHKTTILTDPRKSTSVDVLLINLIRGKLLPSARLWITTRPAAANQIPPDCVGMVTEVRGFTDPQKEEYFRKRFRDKKQITTIISHIKTSRSLHIMCHIPVFCWITATVLEDVLETREGGQLPNTLTEMYIHFLVVQAKVKKVKYDGGAETDPHWSPESRKMMESLGKLAFDQLQKGNLIFYESDLTECGIDIRAASVYSGVFTQIFKEERGLYQDKVFCFIHLSVQEFLAALHVHLTFINSGLNLLEEQQTTSQKSETRESAEKHFYQSAVNKALQSPNGHLDLFLRFLLGLSLQTNQTLLRGLLTQMGSSSQTNQETVQYIKKKLSENLSAEKSINLFHCMNELNDRSLVEEIQQSLRSGSLSTDKLSPAQWSALVFILLSSEKELDVFDLKKYSASEEALLRLLPVVRTSDKALLSGCLITEEGSTSLASALSSGPSHLKELDISYNHPGDSVMTTGLKELRKKVHTLRMTRPAFDPADSDLFERQEAALSIWTEKLKEKQRLFAEREHVFKGTRLALGGPRRRRVSPPAASPAPDHSPRRVDVSRRAAAASSLASPLLAHTPAASFAEPPTSPWHSGYASHLGSTEATAPEASLCTPPASSSRRKRRTRRHKMDYFQQFPVVSSSDCFPPSFDSSFKTTDEPISDSWDVSLLEDSVDWEDLFCSAPPKTVNSDGRKIRLKPVRPVSVTHPVVISTPISQPTPTPVPAPRRRAAATQPTSTPAPVSRVGVTGVQPPPVPVPAPRLKAARTQPDLPRVSEELASPSTTSPLHPPPDPAFHALALSLVKLAEVSPAQAPALLAQAIALSPSLAQSIAQPPATSTTAPSSASPTSIHPLASPLQSVHSPAVQLPAHQRPPRLLAQPVSSQRPPRLLAQPVSSQRPPRLLAQPVSSQRPPRLLAQPVSSQRPPRLLAQPVSSQRPPRLLAQPVSSQRPPRLLAQPVSSQRPPRLLAQPPKLLLRHRRLRLLQPLPRLLLRLVQTQLRLVLRLPRRRPSLHLGIAGHFPGQQLDVIASVVDHRTSSVAAAVFLAAAHRTSSVAAAVFLAAAHRIASSVAAAFLAAALRTFSAAAAVFLAAARRTFSSVSATSHVAVRPNCLVSATSHVAVRPNCLHLDSVPPSWAPSARPVLVFFSFGRRVPAFEGGDSCQLTIDTNTVNTNLQLSDNNRKVRRVEEVQSYPDHPDRFDVYLQLLCRNGLTGRCYWEVEWRGDVCISVSYRRIRRKGGSNDCAFGYNDQSWSLICSDYGPRSVRHNNRHTSISSSSSSSSVSNRAAVYVDCPAGTLSFYRVSSDTLIHLHTFNTTFTQTLYPGFAFGSGSSVSLC
ncbi:unnamed protein product [Oreochromis niloticus]|nr:unnamed protein product [Mustela putorius furo]